MKAIVIGAGRIGRGFVTELLLKNQIEVTFFEASDEMVKKLNDIGTYTIHVLGHEELNTTVEGVTAYPIQDVDTLAKLWIESDFIFTAVGGKNMPAIGIPLGKAFQKNYQKGIVKKLNIITCENWVAPSEALKESILQQLDEAQKEAFLESTGVSESVVMATGTGAPEPDKQVNELDTWMQNMWYLPVDKEKVIGPLPDLECITFIDGFGDLLQQKLYTFNASVATIAFLGRLKGYTYVSEAANDPEIEEILDKAYEEIQAALVKGMGINEMSQRDLAKRAKNKYQDREIIDILTRIARDPIRKLAPTDRLVGPAKLALQVGEQPAALATAIAAALYYEDPEDEIAVELKSMREKHGIDYILSNVCGLESNDPLISLIKAGITKLQKKGWIRLSREEY